MTIRQEAKKKPLYHHLLTNNGFADLLTDTRCEVLKFLNLLFNFLKFHAHLRSPSLSLSPLLRRSA